MTEEQKESQKKRDAYDKAASEIANKEKNDWHYKETLTPEEVIQADAYLEKQTREEGGELGDELIEKMSKSLLNGSAEGLLLGHYGLSGEINGMQIEIEHTLHSGETEGKINGKRMAGSDAQKIYDEYKKLANLQTASRGEYRLEKEARKEELEQKKLEEETKSDIEKIL